MRAMHAKRTKLYLGREAIRILTERDMAQVAGGHPTGFPTVCTSVALRATRSEEDGAGPCPGQYSWTCSP